MRPDGTAQTCPRLHNKLPSSLMRGGPKPQPHLFEINRHRTSERLMTGRWTPLAATASSSPGLVATPIGLVRGIAIGIELIKLASRARFEYTGSKGIPPIEGRYHSNQVRRYYNSFPTVQPNWMGLAPLRSGPVGSCSQTERKRKMQRRERP